MEIKKKYLKRTGWLRIEEYRFAHSPFEYENFSGVCSLMELTKVKKPLIAEFRGETLKIVDDGYFWLQVAPRDENFWITVMYDGDGNLLQYYFDVTKENVICGEDSFFYDLFLDLVAVPDGRLIVLDEDELEAARTEDTVTEKEYSLAFETLEMLKKHIPENAERLNLFCLRQFEKLRGLLK